MADAELSALEQDILGDMAEDSHGVGELAGFYRAGHPAASDAEVFRFVRDLLARWTARGWLEIGPARHERAGLHSVDEVLAYLDQHGPTILSLDSPLPLPEVDLTQQAFHDLEWLRGAI